MIRIQIRLTEQDFRILSQLSNREYRDPRQQAGLLIREALEKRGLISPQDPSPFTLSAAEVQALKHPASAVQGEDHEH